MPACKQRHSSAMWCVVTHLIARQPSARAAWTRIGPRADQRTSAVRKRASSLLCAQVQASGAVALTLIALKQLLASAVLAQAHQRSMCAFLTALKRHSNRQDFGKLQSSADSELQVQMMHQAGAAPAVLIVTAECAAVTVLHADVAALRLESTGVATALIARQQRAVARARRSEGGVQAPARGGAVPATTSRHRVGQVAANHASDAATALREAGAAQAATDRHPRDVGLARAGAAEIAVWEGGGGTVRIVVGCAARPAIVIAAAALRTGHGAAAMRKIGTGGDRRLGEGLVQILTVVVATKLTCLVGIQAGIRAG